MTLQELIDQFTSVRRPGWLVMGDDELTQFGVEAVSFYAGHGDVRSIDGGTPALVDITGDIALTPGEWSIIRPLFLLYVERENALRLEASRANGLEVFGRSASEIAADIKNYEEEVLPSKAFGLAIVVGE